MVFFQNLTFHVKPFCLLDVDKHLPGLAKNSYRSEKYGGFVVFLSDFIKKGNKKRGLPLFFYTFWS